MCIIRSGTRRLNTWGMSGTESGQFHHPEATNLDATAVVDGATITDGNASVAAGAGSEAFVIRAFVNNNATSTREGLHVENEQRIDLVTFRDSGQGVQLPESDYTRDGVLVGVVSPEPLFKIWFDEDAGGDDIRVKNFRFGVR